MKLYELNQAIETFFETHIDEETGEVFGIEELEELELAKRDKIENIALMIKNMAADSKAIGDEVRTLQSRKKAIDNRIKSIKEYLMYSLEGLKFKTPKVSIYYRNTKSVKLPEDIDYDYILNNYKDCISFRPENISKKKIKTKLDEGYTVSGYEVVEKTSMTIR